MHETNRRLVQIHLDRLCKEFNRVRGVRAISKMGGRFDASCAIFFIAPEIFVTGLQAALDQAMACEELELLWVIEPTYTKQRKLAYALRSMGGTEDISDRIVRDLTALRLQLTGDRPTDLGQLAEHVLPGP